MREGIDYVYFARGTEHVAMARQSIDSVRAVDPTASIYIATDNGERPPADTFGYTIPEGMPLQLAKAEVQARHVLTGHYGRLVVFIDSDTLVKKPISEAVPSDADLFVTWRATVHKPGEDEPTEGVAGMMPYNAGVWGCRVGRNSKEALIWLRERVRLRQFGDNITAWFSDQTALAELCGPAPAKDYETSTIRIPWMYHSHGNQITVSKLPCSKWNYSPLAAGEDVSERGILHFKGRHRPFMEAYRNA